ncbi:MAG: Hsp70 family protein [Elainellaceae cyanobacterium]
MTNLPIAIDFGTSNTVVSILEPDTQTAKTLRFPGLSRVFRLTAANGEPQTIPVVPSLVVVKEPNHLVFGEQVRSQRLEFSHPNRLFKHFKRDLAADFQPPPRSLDGQIYSAEAISEQFIHHIWAQLKPLGITPSAVTFTVPVGAFERYLDWFRDIAASLDISTVHLVDESTAAALGYAVQHPGSIVLVIDFGGGTLDLSLVRTAVTPGATVQRATVLAKADAYIGGEDLDIWIVEDYLLQQQLSREDIGEIGWQTLLALAERLKIRVSSVTEAAESWFDDNTLTAYEMRLTRDRLDDILEANQCLEQFRHALDDVLAIALGKGISKTDIEQVLLVGGSCLIPAVQQLVLSYFGRQRVKVDKPFEAVAHGALALSQLQTIDDYLHHSYAIRLWEPYAKTYSYYPLFERGTQYPAIRLEPLILQAAIDGQHDIRLDIGEVAESSHAEVAYDAQGRMMSRTLHRRESYRSLNTDRNEVCVAHLAPPGQIGVDRISVQFEVNDQRVLVATVKDLLTGTVLVEQGAIATLS